MRRRDADMTSAPPSLSDAPRGREPWLALLAILLVGALLRVREASLTPLWFDEIFTLRIARLPFPAMWRALGADIHPPLHTTLLWLWRAGGENPLWLKSLPIAIGLATIAALYAAVREMFGSPAALLAAALLSLHRMHVYFSQEIRSYALLTLTLLLAVWMAWRWLERGRRADGAWFVLAAAAALYTHYMAGLVLALLALWGLWSVRRDAARVRGWIGLHLAIAALFAPIAPMFITQLRISHE